ncbi:MAG: hypothetical protein WCA08_12180 [Desulfoferrobacter sp.]
MTEHRPKTGSGAIPKRDKPHGSPVTVLDNVLIDSPAMLALAASKSGYPMLVYLHFLQKRITDKKANRLKQGQSHKKTRFVNARQLTFSYQEAEALGINNRAFNHAIDRLIDLGFIDLVKPGHGLVKGELSIYGLSDRWQKYGTPQFERASRTKAPGYGFCAHSKTKKDQGTIADCSTCVHTFGGKFACVLMRKPDRQCHRWEKYEAAH